MKTRDAIKLIGDGKAQKLKKDKVIESWIKVGIDTVRAKKKLLSFLGKTTFQLKVFFLPFFVCSSVVLFFLYIYKLRRNYAYVISKTFCSLCTLPTLFALSRAQSLLDLALFK